MLKVTDVESGEIRIDARACQGLKGRMMDRREPADLDWARCGQPIQRDQRWEWEKDRGTARECFGRGQRGSRGSQGLPRDDITSHLVAACSPARGLLPIRGIMSTPWAGPGFLTARTAPPPLSLGCGLLRGARPISASTRGA